MSRPDFQHDPADPSPVFAAMGDRTRLALLDRLGAARTLSISELTRGTGLSRQAITKHLRVLEGAGLVRCSRVGREARFALQREWLTSMQSWLEELSEQWDAALERLRAHVE